MANFSPQKILSSTLSTAIESQFRHLFDGRESALLQTALESADFAMTALAQADTQYHNSEHTFIVSLAGLDILGAKQNLATRLTPKIGRPTSFRCCSMTSAI